MGRDPSRRQARGTCPPRCPLQPSSHTHAVHGTPGHQLRAAPSPEPRGEVATASPPTPRTQSASTECGRPQVALPRGVRAQGDLPVHSGGEVEAEASRWWAMWVQSHCLLLDRVSPGPCRGSGGEVGHPLTSLALRRDREHPGPRGGWRAAPSPGCPHPSARPGLHLLPCPHANLTDAPRLHLRTRQDPQLPAVPSHRRPHPKTGSAALWPADSAASESGLSCKEHAVPASTGAGNGHHQEEQTLCGTPLSPGRPTTRQTHPHGPAGTRPSPRGQAPRSAQTYSRHTGKSRGANEEGTPVRSSQNRRLRPAMGVCGPEPPTQARESRVARQHPGWPPTRVLETRQQERGHHVCVPWEPWLSSASSAGILVTHLREPVPRPCAARGTQGTWRCTRLNLMLLSTGA